MNPINPHGVAKIDLKSFCQGTVEQKYKVGVMPCSLPDKKTAKLLPADWIDAGTILTVRVELSHSISPPPCPFKRVSLVMR
jgi:hypothetical protein